MNASRPSARPDGGVQPPSRMMMAALATVTVTVIKKVMSSKGFSADVRLAARSPSAQKITATGANSENWLDPRPPAERSWECR